MKVATMMIPARVAYGPQLQNDIKKNRKRRRKDRGKLKCIGSSDQNLTSVSSSGSHNQQVTSVLATVSRKGKAIALMKKQNGLPTKSRKGKITTQKKIDIVDSVTKEFNGDTSFANGAESTEEKKNKNKTKKRKLAVEITNKKMKCITEEKIAPEKEDPVQEKEGLTNSVQSSLGEGEETKANVKFLSDEVGAINVQDSRIEGQMAFNWMINPHTEEEFYRNHWEKGPLFVKRDNAEYYKGLFSTAALDRILREHVVLYTKNIDITSYIDGKRETHNPVGQAHAPVVWDYYNNDCSLRMLNPQTFHRPVWKLLSRLQEYFNSFCGANVYLTPPDTQGFAPHWDDIEAFILQLEGKKRWRVYKPR
ncbi:bifunctional lysine-specific demethylase and histidyl-hydroxylase NO66-like isoform X1 [Panulirus ornatus]|uniref:bifunctional lysine-specific demethylase and histidyl-hydroxylase NO66-like isoform X1 n=1 Tax=Panulirus ornatus TaxID=150431 RepID=UPI003A8416F4